MTIEYVKLGRTGVKVSNICIGTDNYGNEYGCDEETAHRILGKALDAGINFVDTADSYNEGRSEQYIGNYLSKSGRRDQVVLATKYRSRVGPGPNDLGGSRYHIVRAVEGSLRRLKTDRIDLYYMHHVDPNTPIEESLRAIDDLVSSGKVIYAGCSNYPAWLMGRSLWVSDVRNLVRFEAAQSVFNILQPGFGREAIPFALEEGVAVVPYSPLASGILTGKHPRSEPLQDSKLGGRDQSRGGPLRKRYWDDQRLDAVDRLKEISEKHNQPMIRLALQWVSEFPGVTAPIFGARSDAQIDGVLDAWSEKAPDEVMAEVRSVAEEFAANSPMNYPPAAPNP